MSQDLIMGFLEKLNKPDPPHGLMLNGVYSASKWFKSLKEDEKKFLYAYMKKELNQNGDLPIKELIMMVLQQIGGADSLEIIDKVIREGETIHGKYLVYDANNAKEKLLSGN